MIGIKGLSEKSVNQALGQMMRRGVIAAPFHISLFLFMILWIKELRPNPLSWVFWGMIVAAGVARVLQFFFARSLLANSRTNLWRAIFAVHTWALGIAWGFNCGYTVFKFGLSSPSVTVFAFTLCIAAASAPAFAFDLAIQFVFQGLMFLPTMTAACLSNDENGFALGVGFLFFLIFITYAALSIFGFQIGILKASELVEKQNKDLETNHKSLSLAHETIETMLESIDEAFLNFDAEGRCTTTASRKSQQILGFDPSGRLIEEILTSNLDERAKLKKWYSFLIQQPDHFESLIELEKRTLVRKSDSHAIRLAFHAVRESDGNIKSVVLTAIDVQQEVEARRLAATAAQRADLILRINDNRSGFQGLLARIQDLVEDAGRARLPLATIRQELHTIKGALAIFGAIDLSRKFFDCEVSIRGDERRENDPPVLETIRQLRREVAEWRRANTALFAQLGLYGDEVVELSKRKLQAVQQEFAATPEQESLAKRILNRLVSVDFGDIFEDFRPHLESTAAKLGKKIHFEVLRPAEPIFVDSKSREMLRTFVHLFNNAIDHGIETPPERVQAGKPADGLIKIIYSKVRLNQRNWIRLIVSDDGAGIDVERIRQKREASSRPLPPGITHLEIAETIFDDAFSTRQNVTEISGQGIGMGAVRAAIQKYGGRIKILDTSRAGLSLEVLLPDEA